MRRQIVDPIRVQSLEIFLQRLLLVAPHDRVLHHFDRSYGQVGYRVTSRVEVFSDRRVGVVLDGAAVVVHSISETPACFADVLQTTTSTRNDINDIYSTARDIVFDENYPVIDAARNLRFRRSVQSAGQASRSVATSERARLIADEFAADEHLSEVATVSICRDDGEFVCAEGRAYECFVRGGQFGADRAIVDHDR